MLTTSEPLLTQEECDLVSGFLKFIAAATYEPDEEFGGNIADIQKGADLLSKVRDQIDQLTGCTTHVGEKPIPQYVVYEPKDAIEGGRPPTRRELLTYGLHVDTNNGEDLRHLTCLLYLNSNDKGATNFPQLPMKCGIWISPKNWSKQLWIFMLQMKLRGVTLPWAFECFPPQDMCVSSRVLMIKGSQILAHFMAARR